MINRELEAKIAALEEFIGNCFSKSSYNDEIYFRFVEDTDVSNEIDPEHLDYLKQLTERN